MMGYIAHSAKIHKQSAMKRIYIFIISMTNTVIF